MTSNELGKKISDNLLWPHAVHGLLLYLYAWWRVWQPSRILSRAECLAKGNNNELIRILIKWKSWIGLQSIDLKFDKKKIRDLIATGRGRISDDFSRQSRGLSTLLFIAKHVPNVPIWIEALTPRSIVSIHFYWPEIILLYAEAKRGFNYKKQRAYH